jgi:hypothetical protein
VQLFRSFGKTKDEAHTQKLERENEIENKRKTDFLFELMFTYNNILYDDISSRLVRFSALFRCRSWFLLQWLFFPSFHFAFRFGGFTFPTIINVRYLNIAIISLTLCVSESKQVEGKKTFSPIPSETSSISRVGAQKNRGKAFWQS